MGTSKNPERGSVSSTVTGMLLSVALLTSGTALLSNLTEEKPVETKLNETPQPQTSPETTFDPTSTSRQKD